MFLSDGLEPISEERISAFEEKWNIILPEIYKDFLLKNNGGKPKPSKFCFFDSHRNRKDESVVNNFYGLASSKKEKRTHLSLDFKMQVFMDRLPEGAIPIASEVFGNQLVMLLSEELGGIYFFDHEYEEDNLYFVAKSFKEFLDILH